ncbi:MAG TPA: DUF3887 domain-containing protein [Anaerolineales bacterium]|nr:DUF3887 domain-containing protein [Anaerolineales bacterium]
MKTKLSLLFLTIFVLFLTTACAPKETPITGTDRDTILAYTESQTDSLMKGLKAGDYPMFSENFDQEMLNAMSQEQFDALKADRDAKLGTYVSRQVNTVFQQGDFYVVVYDAVFEKDDAVTMRVVFRTTDPHQISGLWFNK